MPTRILAPWSAFLRDVDRALAEPVEVHCLGGFVLAVLCGLPRPTGDVDFVEIKPLEAGKDLLRIAGEGSDIAHRHSVHFHRVTIAEYPEGYAPTFSTRIAKSPRSGCGWTSSSARGLVQPQEHENSEIISEIS